MKELLDKLLGASQEGEEKLPTLSNKEELVLSLLLSEGGMFGLRMVEASEGKLKRGTVYVTLDRMEDKGLVESTTEPRAQGDPGIARRIYKATGHGRRVYEVWQMVRAHLLPGRV